MIEKFKTLFFVKSSLISLYLALTIPIPFIAIEKLLFIISKRTGIEVKNISYLSPLWTYKVLTVLSSLMIIGEIFAFKSQMLSMLNL